MSSKPSVSHSQTCTPIQSCRQLENIFFLPCQSPYILYCSFSFPFTPPHLPFPHFQVYHNTSPSPPTPLPTRYPPTLLGPFCVWEESSVRALSWLSKLKVSLSVGDAFNLHHRSSRGCQVFCIKRHGGGGGGWMKSLQQLLQPKVMHPVPADNGCGTDKNPGWRKFLC